MVIADLIESIKLNCGITTRIYNTLTGVVVDSAIRRNPPVSNFAQASPPLRARARALTIRMAGRVIIYVPVYCDSG